MEVVNETTKEVVQEIRTSEEKQKLATVLCIVTHGSFPDSTVKFLPAKTMEVAQTILFDQWLSWKEHLLNKNATILSSFFSNEKGYAFIISENKAGKICDYYWAICEKTFLF